MTNPTRQRNVDWLAAELSARRYLALNPDAGPGELARHLWASIKVAGRRDHAAIAELIGWCCHCMRSWRPSKPKLAAVA